MIEDPDKLKKIRGIVTTAAVLLLVAIFIAAAVWGYATESQGYKVSLDLGSEMTYSDTYRDSFYLSNTNNEVLDNTNTIGTYYWNDAKTVGVTVKRWANEQNMSAPEYARAEFAAIANYDGTISTEVASGTSASYFDGKEYAFYTCTTIQSDGTAACYCRVQTVVDGQDLVQVIWWHSCELFSMGNTSYAIWLPRHSHDYTVDYRDGEYGEGATLSRYWSGRYGIALIDGYAWPKGGFGGYNISSAIVAADERLESDPSYTDVSYIGEYETTTYGQALSATLEISQATDKDGTAWLIYSYFLQDSGNLAQIAIWEHADSPECSYEGLIMGLIER